MTAQSSTLLLLTALVAALVAVLVFAVLRFVSAARQVRAGSSADPAPALMASAIEQALAKLREHERALHARAEASERLSDEIINGIGSGLLVVQQPGIVRLINPAGAHLLGVDAGAAAGHAVRDVLAGVTPLLDVVEEGLRTGRPIARRMIGLPAGPHPSRHLGVSVSPVATAQRTGQVICLFTDLTDAVAREEQLRLKESLARLGELTAGLAHEFRNGLATIHGYARLLDPSALPPEAATYVTGLRQETESLGQVVTNFLEFARPTPLAAGPVSMRALIDRVAGERRPEAEAAGGRLEVAGDFGEVEGDDVLLRQAFDNLCRNACEACQVAGRPPVMRMEGRVNPADQELVVTVADDGPGIDPAVIGRVFQPFVTTRSRGTGLGLALVQKIIVTHNGRITAGNRPEGGAVFEVRLPLLRAGMTKA
jgi:signal transduction histidine kinase